VAFLLAVALAPHSHVNSFEDLLSDGPSDSGIFVASPVGVPESVPCLSSLRLIDDDPCLACFHNDYFASPAAIAVPSTGFVSLSQVSTPPDPAIPGPLSESPASRSPPDSLRLS
jgi:hypothetical protein